MKRRNGMSGGKRQYIVVESGVPHNPTPTTERGKRRRAKKEEGKSQKN